jgi:hypothetical protein
LPEQRRKRRRRRETKKRETEGFFERERGEEKGTERVEMKKKTGERIEKRKQGTTGEKYYKKGDVFWGDRGEKGKPTKKRGRTGSDRGRNKKKYQRRRTTTAATMIPLHRHSTPPDRR